MENLPLVGGCLCLDFVNTTGARASANSRERLTRYSDLLIWSQRTGILDAQETRRLQRAAAGRPADAARALKRAHALREDLYQLFSDLLAGGQAPRRLAARLAPHWRATRRRQELVADTGKFELRLVTGEADLDRVGPSIVMSAVELLTSDRLEVLRRCAECDWLFLDESKNGTRKWCKSMCGNRARAREQYGRRRRRRPTNEGGGPL